jgi:predicted DCC family thiol-disulfide oxidoreductase YuxK
MDVRATLEKAASMAGNAKHLIFYDGVCNLCNGVVGFVQSRDHSGTFGFAPLQSDFGHELLEELGRSAEQLDTVIVVFNPDVPERQVFTGSAAVIAIAKRLGWPWRVAATILSLLPVAVRDWVYGAVARNRYRVFGRRDSCRLEVD